MPNVHTNFACGNASWIPKTGNQGGLRTYMYSKYVQILYYEGFNFQEQITKLTFYITVELNKPNI